MSAGGILILGATGQVGSAVLRHLRGRTDHPVVLGARRPDAIAADPHAGVEARHLDLDDADTLAPALEGITTALLLTGYSVDMLQQSKRFLDAAKHAGVRHVVHLGASGTVTNEVAHWGWHQFVERYIEVLGFDWTHLQPEAFMQNLVAFGWLTPGRLISFIGPARWGWVDCDDVAAVAAEALAEPAKHRDRTYRLSIEAASMEDLARMLSEEIGVPIDVDQREPDRFYEGAVRAGADPAYMNCVRHQFTLNAAGLIPEADATFHTFEQVTGRPGASWREHIRRHAQDLRARLM